MIDFFQKSMRLTLDCMIREQFFQVLDWNFRPLVIIWSIKTVISVIFCCFWRIELHFSTMTFDWLEILLTWWFSPVLEIIRIHPGFPNLRKRFPYIVIFFLRFFIALGASYGWGEEIGVVFNSIWALSARRADISVLYLTDFYRQQC